ncbi:DUF3325 domain-containing protein [Roseicella frigidaeris]|nr:DUF3325 domain-containing protein [Roseicella frigidaeris]
MLLWAFAGLAALCFAMDRHHRQVLDRAPSPGLRLALRLLGGGGLLLALLAAAAHWGWGMGVVAWFGALSVGGFVVVLLLPYAPRRLALLALLAPLLAAWLGI